MQAPSVAYERMRAAYAGWFWKMPLGIGLAALGGILLGRRRSLAGALGLVGGLGVLMDAARERSVYETHRRVYEEEAE